MMISDFIITFSDGFFPVKDSLDPPMEGPYQGMFGDDFPFPTVGYVSSLEGTFFMFSKIQFSSIPAEHLQVQGIFGGMAGISPDVREIKMSMFIKVGLDESQQLITLPETHSNFAPENWCLE